MKYNNKFDKIKKKLKKHRSGDGDEDIYNPFDREIGSILSNGKSKDIKSLSISHKKKIGNVINKDINKRYNSVQKTINRINKDKKYDY
jgi:hypothetical protein